MFTGLDCTCLSGEYREEIETLFSCRTVVVEQTGETSLVEVRVMTMLSGLNLVSTYLFFFSFSELISIHQPGSATSRTKDGKNKLAARWMKLRCL